MVLHITKAVAKKSSNVRGRKRIEEEANSEKSTSVNEWKKQMDHFVLERV